VEISLSFFRTIDNSVPQGKHDNTMRRAGIVAVLVIGAVLVRLFAPRYSLPYIRNFVVHRSEFFTDASLYIGFVPLNVVIFWLLIAGAVVFAFTALRRRARS
jgi:hypothetical protein